MKQTISTSKYLLIFGLPLTILLFLIGLTQSKTFQTHPQELSTGIILDLLLTVPIIYYFLIRKSSISKKSIIYFLLIGIGIITYFIPTNYQGIVSQLKYWLIPVLEIGIFLSIVITARKKLKIYQTEKKNHQDFFDGIKAATYAMFPKRVAVIAAMEIAVFYYAFIDWKKRPLLLNEFSYHKRSGIVAVQYAFIFIILIETMAVHLLLMEWNATVAWILFFLSLYTGLQLFASTKAIVRRPISIENEMLQLRYGFFAETIIPLSKIKEIEETRRQPKEEDAVVTLSPLGGLDGHNLILHLDEPHILDGFYGIKKDYKSIAIFVDDKKRFIEMLTDFKK